MSQSPLQAVPLQSLPLQPLPLQQMSRIALRYFFASFAATVLALQCALPWWTAGIAAACLGWRLMVHLGRWSLPPRAVRVLLVLCCPPLLFWQYGFNVDLDVFAAMLLLGYSLKLLEIYRQRDAQRLLYLGLFFVMTLLVYQQTLWVNLLAMLLVSLQVASMVALHTDARWLARKPWFALQRALLMLALALPLMAFLFLVAPRLAPLWAMPQPKGQAQTGIGTDMSPGDISSLTGSDALVFRAGFTGQLPADGDLYWRGLVLDRFDGRRWTSVADVRNGRAAAAQPDPVAAVEWSYRILLEPQSLPVLFALQPAVVADPAVHVTDSGVLINATGIDHLLSYSVSTYASSQQAPINAALRERNLALPPTGNPQARALARQWRATAAGDDAVIRAALQYFHQYFYYTTEPPLLGKDSIDDFLLHSRAGFCEHFASAFVFLMRAAGIPARVVTGYLGGERHEADHYMTVRQYRAHAWAEVWLTDNGWTRIDPTTAIAEDHVRGELRSDRRPGRAGRSGLSSALLDNVKAQFDRANYLWTRMVVDYDSSMQGSLLQRFGLASPVQLALVIGSVVIGAFVCLLVVLHWRNAHLLREHWATRRYRQLCAFYARCGVCRELRETPLQYAARVQQAGLPWAAVFSVLSAVYYRALFETGLFETGLFAKAAESALAAEFRWQSFVLLLRLYWYARWARKALT